MGHRNNHGEMLVITRGYSIPLFSVTGNPQLVFNGSSPTPNWWQEGFPSHVWLRVSPFRNSLCFDTFIVVHSYPIEKSECSIHIPLLSHYPYPIKGNHSFHGLKTWLSSFSTTKTLSCQAHAYSCLQLGPKKTCGVQQFLWDFCRWDFPEKQSSASGGISPWEWDVTLW